MIFQAFTEVLAFSFDSGHAFVHVVTNRTLDNDELYANYCHNYIH